MATKAKSDLGLVSQWLKEVTGWVLVRANSGEGGSLTPERLLEIAQHADRVELEDYSDLPYAQNGYMHPQGIVLIAGETESFFNAYRTHHALQP